MDTSVTILKSTSALSLVEAGAYVDAEEMLAGRSEGPGDALARAVLLSYADPDKAKDPLSGLADSLNGELAIKARIYLACCYWATGEKEEATATLGMVKPITPETRFIWYLIKSITETNPKRALRRLTEIECLVDNVFPLWRGKFFNQRGYIAHQQREMDAALIYYEEARFYFDQISDRRFVAGVTNNIASIYRTLKKFEEAHASVDKAIESLTGVLLAQALDQKAGIFLAEHSFPKAESLATRSINILQTKDQSGLLVASLLTRARSLCGLERFAESFADLNHARALTDYLNNQDLLIEVERATREFADGLWHHADRLMVQAGLTMEPDSLRAAAKKIRVTHPALTKAIKKYGLKWKPRTPKSIISKRNK